MTTLGGYDRAMTTRPTSSSFGALLKRWRTERRFSQLALAAEAGVSQRHLSFLETGRSRPSREMVSHLAVVLGLPLRSQNELLVAAGFSPAYPESPLDSRTMERIRETLQFLLDAHEPYPAVVVNRRFDLLMSNTAAQRFLFALGVAMPISATPNLIRALATPGGARERMVNFPDVALAIMQRMADELAAAPTDVELRALYDEVLEYPDMPDPRTTVPLDAANDIAVTVQYRIDDTDIRLLSALATFGSPLDVTLQELRLETFFPADDVSDRWLRSLAATEPA